ncbi:hypothetical protein [Cyanobium gracile]|uniref:hypothetical protein n=1 Tax=Cyanobium gracile TaxID=59930 RepID=UPI000316C0C9|nr:hypothetical protein [Cyanobium gracile]
MATVSEHGHGRETTWKLRSEQSSDFITEACRGSCWIFELVVSGKRGGKRSLQRHPLSHQPANHAKSLAAFDEAPLVH